MPVAPIPPTKPTPPTQPVLPPAVQNAPSNSTATVPAGSSPKAGKTVIPEISDAAKKLEGLGKAFQGTNTPVSSGDKTKTTGAGAEKMSNSGQHALPASLSSQETSFKQTAVPAKILMADTKPGFLSYFPFLGIVGATIMILIGLRLIKKQTNRQRMLSNNAEKVSGKTKVRDEIDGVTASKTVSSKVKSRFEVRI